MIDFKVIPQLQLGLRRLLVFGAVMPVRDLIAQFYKKKMFQNNILGAKSFNFFGFLNVDLKYCDGWKGLIAPSGMLFGNLA